PLRLFEGIQILALDIFDQRERERSLIGHRANQGRNLFEARALGRAPAAFTGDDLEVSSVDRAHQDWLHDALRLDRFGELRERGFVASRAWLIAAGANLVDRERMERVSSGWLVCSGQQGVESAPKTFQSSHLRHR